MNSWRDALRCAWKHAQGFPTEELKRYLLNYAFVYCLPRSLQPEQDLAANSDNEGLKDEIHHFNEEELQQASKTRVRGNGSQEEGAAGDSPPDDAEPPSTSTQHDLTVQMIRLSHNFWLGRASTATPTPQEIARQLLREATSGKGVADATRMLAAAQASRNKKKRTAEAPADVPGLDGARRGATAKRATKDRDCLDAACTPETARRIAHWRWLIADEVGMISARLLAQVEARTRSAVPKASQWKHDADGNVRPFAGLN
ncbi:anks1b, partial [Symbiodinium sp. CCMP2456]